MMTTGASTKANLLTHAEEIQAAREEGILALKHCIRYAFRDFKAAAKRLEYQCQAPDTSKCGDRRQKEICDSIRVQRIDRCESDGDFWVSDEFWCDKPSYHSRTYDDSFPLYEYQNLAEWSVRYVNSNSPADAQLQCECHKDCLPFPHKLPDLEALFDSVADRQSQYLHRQGLLSGVQLAENKQLSRKRSHDALTDDESG